jgi:hypothetical protein
VEYYYGTTFTPAESRKDVLVGNFKFINAAYQLYLLHFDRGTIWFRKPTQCDLKVCKDVWYGSFFFTMCLVAAVMRHDPGLIRGAQC